MLDSAAAMLPNAQQDCQGSCILTGVTTPFSRRSNLAGYEPCETETDADALLVALADALADAELALLAALPPHAASIATQTQTHAAKHNNLGDNFISFFLPLRIG